MYTYPHLCMCIYAHIHVCIYRYADTHICTYMYIYTYIFKNFNGVDRHYCTMLALPSFYRTKLERTLLEAGFMSITNALYFSMWNNTKGWPMYIMLSVQATVYTDSNDKYTSIFNGSKMGLSSQFKYSITYLQVSGVWYQGVSWTYNSIEVFCRWSAERSTGSSC